MHIAFYARAWPLGHVPLGVVTYVHCMRGALQALGHRVSIFADLVQPGCEEHDVHPIAPRLARRVKERLARWTGRAGDDVFTWGKVIGDAMAEVHRHTPIDIVEMEESFGWCADVQRGIDAPVLVKLHGPAFLTETGPKAELPVTRERIVREGRSLGDVAALVSPSRYTLEAAAARYALSASSMLHVPNPLPLAGAEPVWTPSGCDHRAVLFVGRFDWIKGGDVVVQAFARLLHRHPDAKLLFVGPDDGLIDDLGHRMQLADYLGQVIGPQHQSSVTFLGKLPAERVRTLRTQALMTIVASRWENQSYTALEAMAQGCPTIATDTGGTPEIVDDGQTGLLCKAGDADSLCAAMSRLIEDPALCARLGQSARAAVLAQHAPAEAARRMLAIYQQVTARWPRRSRAQ